MVKIRTKPFQFHERACLDCRNVTEEQHIGGWASSCRRKDVEFNEDDEIVVDGKAYKYGECPVWEPLLG